MLTPYSSKGVLNIQTRMPLALGMQGRGAAGAFPTSFRLLQAEVQQG